MLRIIAFFLFTCAIFSLFVGVQFNDPVSLVATILLAIGTLLGMCSVTEKSDALLRASLLFIGAGFVLSGSGWMFVKYSIGYSSDTGPTTVLLGVVMCFKAIKW